MSTMQPLDLALSFRICLFKGRLSATGAFYTTACLNL